MKLKTTLLGKTYHFRDVKDVLAKANEEKTGDKLAGLAAETAQERIAAKVVLSEMFLEDLREHPAVKDVGTFTSAAFQIRGSFVLGDLNISTDLFMESVPEMRSVLPAAP